jgi:DNA-binding transcriptional regulator LsrR (DeoR family)
MKDDTGVGRAGYPAARLEQAARAAWLYYVAGRTQDEIAAQLRISRQAAQRLVSLAVAEKLVKFRFDHPIAPCMELSQGLADRFGLAYCDVVPLGGRDSVIPGIAVSGANYLERWFSNRAPLVLGLSAGRTLCAIAAEISPIEAPQHRVISICGTMSRSGRANSYEPVLRLAERTGAQCYPMPTPVVAATVEEKNLLQMQSSYRCLQTLLAEARCLMVGIGPVDWQASLRRHEFVTDAELAALIEAGAVGEIAGWAFDCDGKLIAGSVNDRVAGLPITPVAGRVTVGVAGGADKIAAILAALRGGLVNALITDECSAAALLEGSNRA